MKKVRDPNTKAVRYIKEENDLTLEKILKELKELKKRVKVLEDRSKDSGDK